MNKKLEWFSKKCELNEDKIKKVEEIFNINFPKDYILCVKKHDGGTPSLEVFDFKNHKEAVFNRLLSFDLEKRSNIISIYNTIKDRLLDNVFPIASDPFGNYICFDYRQGKDSPPKVVFWNHEGPMDKKEDAIQYICDNFSELLKKLYNPDV